MKKLLEREFDEHFAEQSLFGFYYHHSKKQLYENTLKKMLPLLGMVPYMILGPNQKYNPVSNKGKQRLKLLARVHPIEVKT